jgi:ABC-2 type transport system permease protein
MRNIYILFTRELKVYFDSLMAYILLILFLGFSGFFTWLYGSDVFLVGQVSLRTFFGIAYWSLFFFIPAITMRLISEEKRSGTIELLLTKAVTDRQVVIGKFMAAMTLIIIALLFTLPYPLTLSFIGNLDAGEVILGYGGLVFLSAAYISIGIYASSITSNQIVAFLLTLFTGLFFQIIFGVLAGNLTGAAGGFFNYLSMSGHFESIARGVLDTRDLIYFGSIVVVGLYLAELTLTRRNANN